MSWTYSQSNGELTDPNGNLVAHGYAGGNCGKNPEGKNNPDMQDQPCIGPLPQGDYIFSEVVDSPKTGHFTIILVPDPSNEMFGRDDFRVHGDSIIHPGCASEGCIVTSLGVRTNMFNSADKAIKVTP
jgi:hypothetical protein